MSEAPKTVEETPVAPEVPEQTEASKAVVAAPETETETPAVPAETSTTEPEPSKAVTEEPVAKGEVLVEATPASEGVLGYKAPGLKQLLPTKYSKHFFWFGEEPLKADALSTYIHSEKKDEVAHHNAAWAQETGKGFLFFAKRAEDKATPLGLIPLADVTEVAKEGSNDFSFKSNKHTYKFQAATEEEQASWMVAIEKKGKEATALKPEIVGSEGYKKNLELLATAPLIPAVVAAAKHETATPKKSLDAATATNGATETETPTEEEEAKKTTKSRSQSRKRGSIFGSLLGKKEERDELKKEEKAEEKTEKAEKKAEKHHLKEEKKAEALAKKEEAKKEHDATKAKEAAEAAAVAALPAVAVAAEEKKAEEPTGATTPTDKRAKRGSVFGIFGKKGLISPTTEKTEKDVVPSVPAKDAEVAPVSETAPQLDQPIESKPIDAAAVTAPTETVQTPADAEEPTAAETSTPAKSEEKSGFLGGLIKKAETAFAKKETKPEQKEEQATEAIAKDPVVAAAPTETTTEAETTPAAATEERPAREKRRTSLFNSLSTKKKTTEPTSEADDAAPAEIKREKSPLPAKLGAIFRRPSRAVRSPQEETKPTTTETASEPTTNGESAITGDVVPEELHAPVHDAVTLTPEVKASA